MCLPHPLNYLRGLQTAGVRILQLVLDLARLIRVSLEAPAGTANPVLSGAQPAQVPFAANVCSLGLASSFSQVGAVASSWIEELFIL